MRNCTETLLAQKRPIPGGLQRPLPGSGLGVGLMVATSKEGCDSAPGLDCVHAAGAMMRPIATIEAEHTNFIFLPAIRLRAVVLIVFHSATAATFPAEFLPEFRQRTVLLGKISCAYHCTTWRATLQAWRYRTWKSFEFPAVDKRGPERENCGDLRRT